MKRLTNCSIYVSMLVLFQFFTCCQKEEVKDVKNHNAFGNETIFVKNGVLNFKSYSVFENTLKFLKNNQDALNNWESRRKGFVSMRSAYTNLEGSKIANVLNKGNNDVFTVIEINGEKEVKMNIDDDVLATIVNSKGIIAIGGDAYKVTYCSLYKVSNNTIEFLYELGANKKSLDDRIQRFDVLHHYKKYDVADVNIEAKVKRMCVQKYAEDGKEKKRRLVGEQWETQIGELYSGVGVHTKHQKQVSGIWVTTKANRLRIRLEASYVKYLQDATQNPGGLVPSPVILVSHDSGWEKDNGIVSYLFDFCAAVNCHFEIRALKSIHECYGSLNNHLGCEINNK